MKKVIAVLFFLTIPLSAFSDGSYFQAQAADNQRQADQERTDADMAAMYQGQQYQREQDELARAQQKEADDYATNERLNTMKQRIDEMECKQSGKTYLYGSCL